MVVLLTQAENPHLFPCLRAFLPLSCLSETVEVGAQRAVGSGVKAVNFEKKGDVDGLVDCAGSGCMEG